MILALLLAIMLLSLDLWAKDSEAYGQAARFISQDSRVATLIGAVNKVEFRFWRGFSCTGDHADFSFQATSGKGSYIVDVDLRQIAGQWRIQEADISPHDGEDTLLILH